MFALCLQEYAKDEEEITSDAINLLGTTFNNLYTEAQLDETMLISTNTLDYNGVIELSPQIKAAANYIDARLSRNLNLDAVGYYGITNSDVDCPLNLDGSCNIKCDASSKDGSDRICVGLTIDAEDSDVDGFDVFYLSAIKCSHLGGDCNINLNVEYKDGDELMSASNIM